ncbi:MAG TPA: hypothetical protein VLX28_13615 [Thermoanaerobaculia bacterium]|nr:hypothetical protein [Thermoanaerobaculia bacterium]
MPNRPYYRLAIGFLAILALAFLSLAQKSSPEIQKLRSLIDKADDLSDALEEVPEAAVDAGPEAIPVLREILARGPKDRGDIAAVALAYIGGETAVDLLWQRYKATKDPSSKALLAMAMSSTPLTAKKRAFLESCLKGEHFGDTWMPIVSAAFSLGVLRASESREALERTAKKTPESIASGAAKEALRWIAFGKWNLEASSLAKIEPPVAAVLRNGVPRTDEAERFSDSDRHLDWIREGATWRVQEADRQGGVPSLSFDVHMSPDGMRALVSVGVTFGSKNGVGYNYVLRKAGAEWVVQSVFFAWIS